MVSRTSSSLRILYLTALLVPAASQAGVTVTWTLDGNEAVATVTGSFSALELAAADGSNVSSFGTVAQFDTNPKYLNLMGEFRQYYYGSNITAMTNFTRSNNYSAFASGDTVGFNLFNGTLSIYLASDYVAGSSISATTRFSVGGQPVETIFSGGEVIKFTDGDALFTYIVVPEPSTYGMILGGLALAGAALRRRRKA